MYMQSKFEGTIINHEGAFVPKDPGNRHYREFLDSKEPLFPWHEDAFNALLSGGKSVNNIIARAGGEIKIVSIPPGATHSGMIQSAPPGFEPGDEKFIKQKPDGSFEFDMNGKFKKNEKVYTQAIWSGMSIWQRFKSKYGRRK